ncbi:amidase signature enzyme [Choiromyces venosus 120613-1]|uniref:Amidase signature enzyme n=1 Tax=Choiromyces venosus 120613-1 TaxID=1336337 RepID=A0A3N4JXX4_9PEZI|nr:amidase signature enzyme [Choiromyces venosus 120613-1]
MLFSLFFLSIISVTAVLALDIDLLTVTAEELSYRLGAGQISSVRLVETYLAQIEAHNVHGLGLRAVIDVAPRKLILDQAALLDHERRVGRLRGPLHGVPILVKDNIATHPSLGMQTTAGSFALEGSIVPDDAGVIARLRKAGAIIIGKSNMSEWANFRAAFGGVPSGWSARGGQTRSAYVTDPLSPDWNPSGSSSGSAVGVSAGFSPLALGTETDGSIILPASYAALYAIKPAVGKVPMDGVIPIGPSLDSVGAMGKSAWDIATTLGVMTGDEGSYLDAIYEGMGGLRIGILREPGFWDEPALDKQIIDESLDALRKLGTLGAVVIDSVYMPTAQDILFGPAEMTVLTAELKESLPLYLLPLKNTTIRTLSDIITFNTNNAQLEMPPDHCCQELLVLSNLTNGTRTPAYLTALAHLHKVSRADGIDSTVNNFNVDLLVMPVDATRSTAISAVAGWPIATVPVGVLNSSGRPFGLAVFTSGTDGKGEERLVRFMGSWSTITGKRSVPGRLRGGLI